MKILFVHNYYRSSVPSGENKVVDSEIAMLLAHGHEVDVFRRDNDAIRRWPVVGAVLAFFSMVANPFAAFSLRRMICAFRPDIVHIHNLFPLISPLALLAVGRTPCVMTLHNYRLFCAGETACRDGKPCTTCLEKRSVRDAFRYRCYRGSMLATLPLALSIALCRALGLWRTRVSRFIVLTDFQKKMVIKAGLPEDKVVVKPNHYVCRNLYPTPWKDRTNRVVYVGRVSREKGCMTLVEAWNRLGDGAPMLVILGDGAELRDCKRACRTSRVEFCGNVSHDMVVDVVANSKLLVLPSLCLEGLPTSVIEAFSSGTPVLASGLGAAPAMLQGAGLTFEPGSSDSLLATFKELWKDDARLERMGTIGLQAYLRSYTEDVNYRNQLDCYDGTVRR